MRNRKEPEKMDENNEEQMLEPKTAAKESALTNELTKLGNQAVKKGLISGHGYHGESMKFCAMVRFFSSHPKKHTLT